MITRIAKLLATEVRITARDPARLRHLLNPRRWGYFNALGSKLTVSEAWRSTATGIQARQYQGYDQYVAHQSAKLQSIDLTAYDRDYRRVLAERLKHLQAVTQGQSVLCLAARIGTEVKAFIDNGCFAVGIDLNPGNGNKYVVVGDFHNLQYGDETVDAVFSNSMDHAFELDKVAAEVHRVLRPGGRLILELVAATDQGHDPGFYASTWWDNVSVVIERFEAAGFEQKFSTPIEDPWKGHHVWLQKLGSRLSEASA
jgi:SAM-dependent methyltransferase